MASEIGNWPRPPGIRREPAPASGAPHASFAPAALDRAPGAGRSPPQSSRTPWSIQIRDQGGSGDVTKDPSPSNSSGQSLTACAPAPASLLSPRILSPRKLAAAAVPKEYCCGLTGRIMREPVVLADGASYEKAEIEAWLVRGERASPKTREPLAHLVVVPNAALKSLIASDPRVAAAERDAGVVDGVASLLSRATLAPPPRSSSPGSALTSSRSPPGSIRFVEGDAGPPLTSSGSPKAQGVIEWFISKPGMEGYGEIGIDGGLEQMLGKVWVWEKTLGRVVPKSGTRVAFRAEPGVDKDGNPRTVATEVHFVHLDGGSSPRGSEAPLTARSQRPALDSGPRRVGTPRSNKNRMRGSCTWFSNKFGFLRPDDGSADVFVHATAVEHLPGGEVRSGDYCEFRVATYGGRDRAVDVTLLQSGDALESALPTPLNHRPMGQELAAHETRPYSQPRGFGSFYPDHAPPRGFFR
mmetsp:Transcript_22326/g.68914  ORF Transcript_22326/g.68914 Transcript_22326/m.68914 type:complete len:469 (-) Transcript_22326:192-1598(-)